MSDDSAPRWTPDWPRPETWAVIPGEAEALLLCQMCPVCGEGPWKSPLNHVAKKHGIDRHTMRDICGLTTTDVVTAPELSVRLSEASRGRDMTEVTAASRAPRRKYRMTVVGKQRLSKNLEGVTPEQSRAALTHAHTPDAQAKRSATLRAKWEAATVEERAQWGARVGGDQEHMDMMRRARWETQPLQPCGTVAAYKRGCRCEPCRDAKRRSRQSSRP